MNRGVGGATRPEFVLELVPLDDDPLGADSEAESESPEARCMTLAELRRKMGGDRGALTDPAGNEHLVVLGWPKMDASTKILIRYHAIQ